MGLPHHLFTVLSLLAAYSMYCFAFQNGLIANLELAAATRVLPGGAHIPLITQYTKIPLLDVFLRSTVIFFWPVTRGVDPPGISVYGCAFAGGMAGAWVLWTRENAQRYSPVSALVRTTLQGLVLQVAGPGVIMPLLLGWDLLHRSPRTGRIREARGQHLAFLDHLPAALVLGFLAPILGAAFLYPTVISFDQSQMLIAFWQGWPIWTNALTLTLFSLRTPTTPGKKNEAASCHAAQALHVFAFSCAAISHWILCMSSLASLTSADSSSSLLRPASLLLPRLPWSHARPSSVGEGVLWFLQWDYSVAAMAVLIWSVALWLRAMPHASVYGSRGALVLQVTGWSLVAGPCGAAVVLMWKRHRLLSGAPSPRDPRD